MSATSEDGPQTTLHGAHVDAKPLETDMSPKGAMPGVGKEAATQALDRLTDESALHGDVTKSIHGHHSALHKVGWLSVLVPGIEDLASKYHVGNYVIDRTTGDKFFESMPIYARIGMHLLFYGKEQINLLHSKTVEEHLKEQSIKEGKIFDSPESVKNIPSFAKTYNLQLDELLNPDLNSYKTMNEFFYRKLKPGARPVQNEDDVAGFCSAADCRITVFPTVKIATDLWIKGTNFSVPNLLDVPADSHEAQVFDGASVAVFRLAPADYHRFHCPIDGTVGETHHIPGQYYTVNPQAVNEPGFDVFTANTRSVLYLNHKATGLPVAFVAIGALLVGSIAFTVNQGEEVKRGQELGYFAYGGSTVVVLFPKGLIEFDADLVANSSKKLETLVKVGNSLGKTPVA